LEQVRQQARAEAWRSMTQRTPAASASDMAVGSHPVEGTPIIMSLEDSGRPKPNTMRDMGQRQKRDIAVQAFVCAGMQSTIKRPIVVAFQHVFTSDQPGNKWAAPSALVPQRIL
jgi:hypothetical protein